MVFSVNYQPIFLKISKDYFLQTFHKNICGIANVTMLVGFLLSYFFIAIEFGSFLHTCKFGSKSSLSVLFVGSVANLAGKQDVFDAGKNNYSRHNDPALGQN